jgi:hypothetical protein
LDRSALREFQRVLTNETEIALLAAEQIKKLLNVYRA